MEGSYRYFYVDDEIKKSNLVPFFADTVGV